MKPEVGTEVISMQEHSEGKLVTVDVTVWEPKSAVGLDRLTEMNVDAVMMTRAKARALIAAGVKESLMDAISSVASGNARGLTREMSRDPIGSKYEEIYKRYRVKILVYQ